MKDVTVYLRPGCPFCHRLVSQLEKTDLKYEVRDIWDDPEAAAFVRSVADGNETVPTVTIGDISLVNPPANLVVEAASA